MKQIIKSATTYSAPLPSADALQAILEETGFAEMLSLQIKSIGFVPREGFFEIVQTFPGGLAFTVRIDQKIIPSSVVRAETTKRVKSLGYKPSKADKSGIKQQVIDELAQVALTRTQLVTCFHHTASNLLIIPASKKLAGEIVSALVYTIGSLKTTTINISDIKQGLTTRLKAWVDGELDTAFDGLHPTNEVVLSQDTRRLSVKMADLNTALSGLREALAAFFSVKSIGFIFPNSVELRVTDEFALKSIWIPLAAPEGGEDEPEFAAQAALEVAAVVEAVQFLCTMFDYKEPVGDE